MHTPPTPLSLHPSRRHATLPLAAFAALLCGGLGALTTTAGCADRIEGLIDCETDEDCPDGYCDQTSHYCFSGQRDCERDTDCDPPARICLNGQCKSGCTVTGCALGETCNPDLGRCRLLQSCSIDSNCNPPALVCLEGYCEPGCDTTGCLEGYCDPYSGHCQGGGGCSHDGDCLPPSTVCEGSTCVQGCLATDCEVGEACNQQTGRCEPVGGCAADSQCDPPSTVCEAGTCVPGCLSAGCAGTDVCNDTTGRCEASAACAADGDCSPPSTICEGYQCVPGCLSSGCVGTDTCNQSTGRCEPAAGCSGDGDCSPPSTICEGNQCVPGCLSSGCAGTDTCNQSTGRCEAATLLPDGADCTANGDCQSGLCRYLEVYHGSTLGWQSFNICTTECCSEVDCQAHAACLYHDGAKMCIPDRIYPAGYSFTLSAGQACGTGTAYCRSGFCNPDTNVCGRTCCESADCGSDLCSWYMVGDLMWEVCRAYGGIGPGTTGASCSSEYDCQSFVCLVPQYQCADMCCSNADCPTGTLCAQILGGTQADPMATTVCVPGTPGATTDGGTCTAGDAPSPACASGLCAGGTCRSPCCHDSDCPVAGQTCTTVPSGLDLDGDGQGDWVRACVP